MLIADLHIHSKYSRATSRDCVAEQLDFWGARKGIGLIGTGDFTHPAWRAELKEKLMPAEDGLYCLKPELRITENRIGGDVRFVVSGEISSIYKKNGKTRKIHNLILLPGLEEADRLSKKLEAIGNIHSDGRPILGLDSHDLLEITLETCPDAIFIPAHIWTPHFSLFGAFSGFDTIEECFEDLTPHIHALETGLSSDPPMNWRVSALDRYTMVSHSDAHSPAKLGREADLLDISPSYQALNRAICEGARGGFYGTIEFFPEEGKYHYDGHRACGLCLKPQETAQYNGKCPVCGKKITIGVEHRVEQLADRAEGCRPENARHFESLVPLPEVIAASTGRSAASKRVQAEYEMILGKLGPEFGILRDIPLDLIGRAAGPCVEEGIRRLREGKVKRIPGYDGEYGTIELLTPSEITQLSGQLSFLPVTSMKLEGKEKPKRLDRNISPEPVKEEGPASRLNPEQMEAVRTNAPAAAVVAGPGTGKTKTLVSRILFLIQEQGVKPSEITAVTFTNQAAREMKERLEEELGTKRITKSMTIGTFHAICMNQLKRWEKGFSLVDELTAEELAKKVLKQFGSRWNPKRLLREISLCKNCRVTKSETLPAEWYQTYQQCLEEQNLLDYDDLLIRALQHWEQAGKEQKREAVHSRYLLVDEFQDINTLQYQLILQWNQLGKGLFVIGDPDQAIYGFRGADAYCFEKLKTDFPALQEIRLTRNYRSSPEILTSALSVISRNPGEERILLPQLPKSEKPVFVRAESDLSEAIFIAKEINRMVGGMDMLDAQSFLGGQEKARSFSDIAVLYRTHRQEELLEQCLRKESIPYAVAGRDDLLSDPLVNGTVSFFRFLLESDDHFSLRVYLNRIEKLSATEAERVAGEWKPDMETVSSERWADRIVRYRKKLKQKPEKLVADWISELQLTDSKEMGKLLNMAVFHPDLLSFLNNLTFGEEGDWKRAAKRSYVSDAVTLMTFHASKGLEYPVVFLCGAKKGIVPMERPGTEPPIEEERRLFYVAMTRAKETLILSAAQEPSAFLGDIPREQLQTESAPPGKERAEGKQLSFF